MISLPHALLALALLAQTSATLPLGYHRRQLDGWTLLAVSVPIPDYTVCVMDRPNGHALPIDEEMLATVVAGHPVERLDGDEPIALVRRLLEHRALPAVQANALSIIDRHLLALAGARWPSLGVEDEEARTAAPLVLLAGSREPDELMGLLVRAARELPAVEVSTDADPAPAPAVTGWWRHIDEDGPSAVAVGVPIAPSDPELEAGGRIALAVLEHALVAEGRATPAVRRLELDDGAIAVFEWAAPPDSAPALRAEVAGELARLRRSVIDRSRFEGLRNALIATDREAIRRPEDRWFSTLLAAGAGGALPRSAQEARRVWDRVTRESVREASRAVFPHDPVLVSAGRFDEGPPAPGPTEIWPAGDHVYAETLEPDDRAALVAYVLARARRVLWEDAAPSVATVESDWVLAREDGPLTGRLVETLRYPDAIRRDYYPAGPDLVFSTWLAADSLGATIQGAPMDTLPGERARLEDRRDADPWNVVQRASSDPARVAYEGVVHVDGETFQGLTIDAGDYVLGLRLDPETGVPARVFIDRGRGYVTSEYRFSSYSVERGVRYPGRIERHVGARREAVLTVRSHASAGRLAASERLK